MSDDRIDLQDALFILDIQSINSVKEEDLTSIRRKAQKRWHPDTIAAKNPSKEEIDRYTRNFRNVEAALSLVRAYVRGEYRAGETASGTQSSRSRTRSRQREDQQQRERQQRERQQREQQQKQQSRQKRHKQERTKEEPRVSVADMQAGIGNAWQKVVSTHYKESVTTTVHKEGNTVRNLIREDLRRHFAVKPLKNFIVGYIAIIVIHTLISFLTSRQFQIDLTPMRVLIPYGCIFILAILPISRYWLPKPVKNTVWGIERVLFFINTAWKNGLSRLLWFLASIIAWPVYILILYPLYFAVELLLGSQTIGRVEEKSYSYAGFTQDYIQFLVATPEQNLNDRQIFDLKRAYQEFKQFIVAD